jgi:hypothetical protein
MKALRRASEANLRPFFQPPRNRTLAQVIDDPTSAPIAVVAGNGPSLLHTPLHHLSEFPLFVCNRANRIEALMRLRPRYWVWGDLLEDSLGHGLVDAFEVAPLETTFILTSPGATEQLPAAGRTREVIWARHHKRLLDDFLNPLPPDRLEPIESLGDCYKIRHAPMLGIQAALWLGYKTVILVGIDHDFALEQLTGTSKTVVRHAYDETKDDAEVLQHVTYLNFTHEVRITWGTYAALNNLATRLGARILDATPGGQIDVFDRLLLDEA